MKDGRERKISTLSQQRKNSSAHQPTASDTNNIPPTEKRLFILSDLSLHIIIKMIKLKLNFPNHIKHKHREAYIQIMLYKTRMNGDMFFTITQPFSTHSLLCHQAGHEDRRKIKHENGKSIFSA